MNPHPMNIYALDSRNAGSLTGLGKSLDALDEQLFSSQEKIIGKPKPSTSANKFPADLPNYRVHRVHRVIFLTGDGFRPHSITVHALDKWCGLTKYGLRRSND